jgi:hypothetical protein
VQVITSGSFSTFAAELPALPFFGFFFSCFLPFAVRLSGMMCVPEPLA